MFDHSRTWRARFRNGATYQKTKTYIGNYFEFHKPSLNLFGSLVHPTLINSLYKIVPQTCLENGLNLQACAVAPRQKYIRGCDRGTWKLDSDISPTPLLIFTGGGGEKCEIWPRFSTIQSPVRRSGIETQQAMPIGKLILFWQLRSMQLFICIYLQYQISAKSNNPWQSYCNLNIVPILDWPKVDFRNSTASEVP